MAFDNWRFSEPTITVLMKDSKLHPRPRIVWKAAGFGEASASHGSQQSPPAREPNTPPPRDPVNPREPAPPPQHPPPPDQPTAPKDPPIPQQPPDVPQPRAGCGR